MTTGQVFPWTGASNPPPKKKDKGVETSKPAPKPAPKAKTKPKRRQASMLHRTPKKHPLQFQPRVPISSP